MSQAAMKPPVRKEVDSGHIDALLFLVREDEFVTESLITWHQTLKPAESSVCYRLPGIGSSLSASLEGLKGKH